MQQSYILLHCITVIEENHIDFGVPTKLIHYNSDLKSNIIKSTLV